MKDHNNFVGVGYPSSLERLYRKVRPIASSPEPQTDEDAHKLQLVPAGALTRRLEVIARTIQAESKEMFGDYVEFGVYNGTSMSCMFRALTRLGINTVNLFGFDSFEGLPPEAIEEDGGVWRVGQFACPKNVALRNLASQGVPLQNVILVEGWYKDTLTKFIPNDYGIQKASIVMIDCDTYSAAQAALQFIYPCLSSVCAIIFDDWKLNQLDVKRMGEFRAFNEFVTSHPNLSVEELSGYNRKSKIFFVRSSPAEEK